MMRATGLYAAPLIVFTALAFHASAAVTQTEPAAPVGGLMDETQRLGAQLWDRLAPSDVKQDYRFPSQKEWNGFWQTVQDTLAQGSVEDLAALRPYARDAVLSLQRIPKLRPYAGWLHARLGYFDAGELLLRKRAPARQTPERQDWSKTPRRTAHPPAPLPTEIRQDAFWKQRVESRIVPAKGAELAQRLKPVFAAEGVPPALVWLAEVESSMRPDARSPVGAAGLFQFMPATAERFGLSLKPRDERNDPEKSARAAAQYLALLHRRFGSWALALAAYNAGEGRVGRAMTKHGATTFEQVSDHLPSETQLYVPNVLATVRAREGVALR